MDYDEGILLGCRYLIHDRDPLFTIALRETLGVVLRYYQWAA